MSGANPALATYLTQKNFGSPQGLAVNASGNVYVSDSAWSRIIKVLPNGSFSVVAGLPITASVDTLIHSTLLGTGALAADPAGNLYFADTSYRQIRKLCMHICKESLRIKARPSFMLM